MKQIRVLQMIDSLHAGGAEMVAVNLANELSKQEAVDSYLLSYKTGGNLEERVSPDVKLFILQQKRTIDQLALWRLYRFFRKMNFDIVHVHSATFYYPVLLKRFFNYKLVWHDHQAKEIHPGTKNSKIQLKTFASYLDHGFTVNRRLLEPDKNFFGITSGKLSFLANFSTTEANRKQDTAPFFELKGSRNDRVVCLANLRPHKDHINLLRAFKLVLKLRPTSYLYLIGKGNGDAYEKKVVQVIKNLGLECHVIWLGSVARPSEILNHCAIGVLSLEQESLPLAIMEYAQSNLAIVATTVEEMPMVLTNDLDAMLVPPKNPEAMAAALLTLLNNKSKMIELHQNLSKLVQEEYSVNSVMKELMSVYSKLLQNSVYSAR